MLPSLVQQARKRLFNNDLIAQGANAFSAALLAFILMLVLGSQVLDWRLAALLPLAAAAAGIARAWKRRPSEYAVSQLIDQRLGLPDTLSTAIFFHSAEQQGRVPAEVREAQYRHAEREAATVDLPSTIPYRMPRAAYAMAGLVLVASSLFALRYGLSRQLDLRPPLARMIYETMGGGQPSQEATARKKNAPKLPDLKDEMGISLSDQDEKANALDPAKEDALQNSELPDLDNSKTVPVKSGAQKNEEGEPMAGDEEGSSEDGQTAGGEDGSAGQPGSNQPKDAKQAASNQQPGSSDNNSLMQKFKEAMQNLMSKMKDKPAGNGQKQSQEMAQGNKQGKQSQGGKKDGSQGQKQSSGDQAESQDGEPGDDQQNSQNAQTKGSGQSNEQQANKQPGSGVGKQDGDKELKLAEQMAAMGKISEIIGKRAATVSGEAMVEVQNTNQQLTTKYEGRKAVHTEAGTEIHRDEVPVALQGYVTEYFEQVRKAAKK